MIGFEGTSTMMIRDKSSTGIVVPLNETVIVTKMRWTGPVGSRFDVAKALLFLPFLVFLLLSPLPTRAQSPQGDQTAQSQNVPQPIIVRSAEETTDSNRNPEGLALPLATDGMISASDALATTEPLSGPAPSLHEDPGGWVSSLFDQVPHEQGLSHDLSPWGMFLAADWVVKGVMLGLGFASLITWTVWLAKTTEIACANARARRTLLAITSSQTLIQAANAVESRGGPVAFMTRTATRELELSDHVIDLAGGAGAKERVAIALDRIQAQAGRRLMRGTGVLATIGCTAPFVGLFGTVWGIMNSFIGISQAQTTNLAVVAPGIAEALLATAIGLVAAIPAVIIYNLFARSITGYRQLLGDAATAVSCLLSRDLDLRRADRLEFAQSELEPNTDSRSASSLVSSLRSSPGSLSAAG